MTTGLGFSIGAANSVAASFSADRTRFSVRSRRTAVTFDEKGRLRLCSIPQFDDGLTNFADLGRDPSPVIVGGRVWSPANLVAGVVHTLRGYAPDIRGCGVMVTYPAIYSDKQVALLRQALDLSGAGDVLLVPEPVAATEWLEHESGPLGSGFVLVYDLGATSLDVTVLRVGPRRHEFRVVGKPLRSYDFGGRPLGSMIARYAPGGRPGSAGLSLTSIVDIDGMRTTHVRDSLDVVRMGIRAAGLTMSDIGRVLLVGGASRPPEVARVLAELGRPVVISADPGATAAEGAALMAARARALAGGNRGPLPKAAVFSSVAVVSAVAMSSVTVFGGPMASPPSPVDRFPELASPGGIMLYDAHSQRAGVWSTVASAAQSVPRYAASALAPQDSAYNRFVTSVPYGPSVFSSEPESANRPRSWCGPGRGGGGSYADPARFVNPIPFGPRTPGSTGTPSGSGAPPPTQPGRHPVPVPHPAPGHPGPGQPVPGPPPVPGHPSAPGSQAPGRAGAPDPGPRTPRDRPSSGQGSSSGTGGAGASPAGQNPSGTAGQGVSPPGGKSSSGAGSQDGSSQGQNPSETSGQGDSSSGRNPGSGAGGQEGSPGQGSPPGPAGSDGTSGGHFGNAAADGESGPAASPDRPSGRSDSPAASPSGSGTQDGATAHQSSGGDSNTGKPGASSSNNAPGAGNSTTGGGTQTGGGGRPGGGSGAPSSHGGHGNGAGSSPSGGAAGRNGGGAGSGGASSGGGRGR